MGSGDRRDTGRKEKKMREIEASDLDYIMWENKISNKELATAAGVTSAAISLFKHGKKRPSEKTMEKIRSYLSERVKQ